MERGGLLHGVSAPLTCLATLRQMCCLLWACSSGRIDPAQLPLAFLCLKHCPGQSCCSAASCLGPMKRVLCPVLQVLMRLQPLDLVWVAGLPAVSEELLFRGGLIPALAPDW